MKKFLAALAFAVVLTPFAAAQDELEPSKSELPERTTADSPKTETAPAAPKSAPMEEMPDEKDEEAPPAKSKVLPPKTLPSKTVAPKIEEPKAAEPTKLPEPVKPAALPPPKELTACAKAFVPLADGYKKAYEDMQKWIADVDARTSVAEEKVQNLQERVQQNEAAVTKAKLEGDSRKERELARDNRQLWLELSAAKKERSALCSGFARDAAQKAKDFAAETSAAVQDLKSKLK